MLRRALLVAIAAGLAGCAGGDPDHDDRPADDGRDDPTDDPSDTDDVDLEQEPIDATAAELQLTVTDLNDAQIGDPDLQDDDETDEPNETADGDGTDEEWVRTNGDESRAENADGDGADDSETGQDGDADDEPAGDDADDEPAEDDGHEFATDPDSSRQFRREAELVEVHLWVHETVEAAHEGYQQQRETVLQTHSIEPASIGREGLHYQPQEARILFREANVIASVSHSQIFEEALGSRSMATDVAEVLVEGWDT